jgi:hypothetical protein
MNDADRLLVVTAHIFGIVTLLGVLSLGLQQSLMGRTYGVEAIRWMTLLPMGLFCFSLAAFPAWARLVDVLVWLTLFASLSGWIPWHQIIPR